MPTRKTDWNMFGSGGTTSTSFYSENFTRQSLSDMLRRRLNVDERPQLLIKLSTNRPATEILAPVPEGTRMLVGTATIHFGPLSVKAEILRVWGFDIIELVPLGWEWLDSGAMRACRRTALDIISRVAKEERERAAKPPPPPPSSGLPWSTLGLSGEVEEKAARSAFRKAAKMAHPDRGGSDDRMREVLAAWTKIREAKGWR